YRYLPRHLIDLPKQGFGLPMSDWARTSLLDVAGKLLESDDSRVRASVGSVRIGRFLTQQGTPGHFSRYQVWCVAMLESWLRHHPVKLPSLADQAAGGQRRDTPVAAPIGQSMYLVFKAAANEVAADSTVLTLPETGEPPTSEDL